jgi:hypothetical protein
MGTRSWLAVVSVVLTIVSSPSRDDRDGLRALEVVDVVHVSGGEHVLEHIDEVRALLRVEAAPGRAQAAASHLGPVERAIGDRAQRGEALGAVFFARERRVLEDREGVVDGLADDGLRRALERRERRAAEHEAQHEEMDEEQPQGARGAARGPHRFTGAAAALGSR